MEKQDNKTCSTCSFRFKRCSFSFKKYGSYECPWECIRTDEVRYKKDRDTCEHWKQKDED